MGTTYKYHSWQGYSNLVPFKDFPPVADSPVKDEPNQLNNINLDKYFIDDDNAIITSWFKKGLAGWRFDVAKEVPAEFWEAVRTKVKTLKTTQGDEPLLLGEIWQDGSQFLTGDQFDSVMNYKLSFAVGDLFLNKGDAAAADVELKTLQQNYPKEALYDLMNIVDSHDVVRAIFKFGGGQDSVTQASLKDFNYEEGKAKLKLAATFLMGYPGMPTIYYGDEVGVYGSSDPDCRRTYPWGHEDQELLSYYKKIIKVRNDHKQLFAHGDVFTLKADGDVYVYGRSNQGEDAIIAMNRGNSKEIVLDASNFAEGTLFKDALDDNYTVSVQNGRLTLELGTLKARMMLNK
jgi:glycosidase